MNGNSNENGIGSDYWRKDTRRVLVRLAIELFLAGPGATLRPPDSRLVYLVVLDATLSGLPIAVSRIALITNMKRTTVRRKLQDLKADGLVHDADDGWRVVEEYMHRSELQQWIVRLMGMVRRANDTSLGMGNFRRA